MTRATGASGAAVVETHASVLVFSDDVVLKYKKPLRFPFADFTTTAGRLAACRAEVDANRRLSPDVYLGVADVVLGDRVLDHAVVMRRLPADRSLARMVTGHAPDLDDHLRRVAAVLADFHARAARSPEIAADAGPEAVERVWCGCLDALRAYAGDAVDRETVERVRAAALRYVAGRRALLHARAAAGKVCDGHGDLQAGDIFVLDDGPRVLDCVEFDPSLRHVDVIADVTFLAMDLERLGAPAAAATFLRLYQEAAGDVFPASLVHHFCAQRAVVRAEVACIRGTQDGDAGRSSRDADDLLALALDHLDRGRVVLGVVSGLPGTGKSTVSGAVGERLGWPVLRSDEVRRELLAPASPQAPREAFGVGAYSPAATEATYRTMLERARVSLELGQPVVLDATFTDPRWQHAAEVLARATASDLVVLECRAAAEIAVPRLRARQAAGRDVSAADEAVARALAERADPWVGAIPLDTAEIPLARSVEAALAALRAPAAALVTS